jgi:hypothetical protein
MRDLQMCATELSERRALCLLVLLALGFPSAFAGDVKAPRLILNAGTAGEFPRAVFEKITTKIARQTTFRELSPDGFIRWSPQTVRLVEFVKAPSPTYSDTYLYAMRYIVSVISDRPSLAVYGCQVTVVYTHTKYAEPTVVCQPVRQSLPSLQVQG